MDGFFELFIQGSDLSPWVFLGLCTVSFVGSFIAASLGLGGGLLVLTSIALVLPPTVLIPVHGVVQLGSNLGRVVLMARQVFYFVVPAFLVGTVMGAGLGAHVVLSLPKWVLFVVLATFVLYATWAPRFQSQKPNRLKFFLVGSVSTFVTMFVGATGILIGPFVAAACGERQQVVATHAMLMSIQHSLKVLAFGMLGFAFGPYIPLLVGLLAFGLFGTYIGRMVLNRLPERIFRHGLRMILTLLSIWLLYDAFRAYPG